MKNAKTQKRKNAKTQKRKNAKTQTANRKTQNAKCKMENAKWKMKNATWKTQNAKCKMQRIICCCSNPYQAVISKITAFLYNSRGPKLPFILTNDPYPKIWPVCNWRGSPSIIDATGERGGCGQIRLDTQPHLSIRVRKGF